MILLISLPGVGFRICGKFKEIPSPTISLFTLAQEIKVRLQYGEKYSLTLSQKVLNSNNYFLKTSTLLDD
ncbi:CLUMA_CG019251, isoform A [Clunio marinus]|uniref:CLUMA_CG019251, isoform A n=1 Tax=Clunio marinus TaxID=568069 RepID=A0A1J1J2T1_9DIPT|nr:CLUMA_CG019251, isoform A [Clunio marinus]